MGAGVNPEVADEGVPPPPDVTEVDWAKDDWKAEGDMDRTCGMGMPAPTPEGGVAIPSSDGAAPYWLLVLGAWFGVSASTWKYDKHSLRRRQRIHRERTLACNIALAVESCSSFARMALSTTSLLPVALDISVALWDSIDGLSASVATGFSGKNAGFIGVRWRCVDGLDNARLLLRTLLSQHALSGNEHRR